MKRFLISAIILFITPIWLVLLFVIGQNSAAYLLNSKEKNILSVKNITLPKLYLVQSGSMEPAVGVGSVVVVSPDTTYVNGDIVAFDLQGTGKNIITHRIAYKEYPNGINGEPVYATKGDANEDFDSNKVTNKNIVGKVSFTIPYLGYLASYAKKPWGFILLVIVPATILIYEELKTIFGETKKGAKKAFGKLRRSDLNTVSLPYPESIAKPKRNIFSKLFKSSAYFIPIFGAGLVFVSLSAAFFSDKEETVGNLFQAAGSFGTPTPEVIPVVTPPPISDHVVINEVYYRIAQEHRMGSEAGSEWAELYNPTYSPVDLTGWSISDNTACDNIPDSPIIPPLEFAIIASKPLADFVAVWGSLPPGTVYIESPTAIGNGLANNDELILQQGICGGTVVEVDHISWGSNTNGLNPSIPAVSSAGISSERSPDGKDTGLNTDFVDSNPPTPGI